MAMTWPSRARSDDEGDAPQRDEPLRIGVAEPPSSLQVYNPRDAKWEKRDESEDGHVTLLGIAGRLGSVTKASRQPQAALGLLLRISSTEWSEQISPNSPDTTLYRKSQMEAAESWVDEGIEGETVQQFAEVLRQSEKRGLWLCSIRIPGRMRYLAALDEAVQQCVHDGRSPTDALQAAADKWKEITAERGVGAQKAAYWRSLGMEPE